MLTEGMFLEVVIHLDSVTHDTLGHMNIFPIDQDIRRVGAIR